MIRNPLLPSTQQVVDPEAYTNSVIQAIISIFLIVGVLYFIWHFVFAGFHLMTTNGDPKKYESAKDEIMWAIVGLVVIFSIFAILRLIGVIVGIPSLGTLRLTFPTL